MKTPALGVSEAGVGFGDPESIAASENFNSTLCCLDANPLEKRPLAAVRGGVKVRTVGSCRKPTHYPLPHLLTQESLAQAVGTKIFLADISPRFRHKRKTQRRNSPLDAGQDCSSWAYGSFVASGDEASILSHISAIVRQ
jgi:hypothetical protein